MRMQPSRVLASKRTALVRPTKPELPIWAPYAARWALRNFRKRPEAVVGIVGLPRLDGLDQAF